MSTDVHSLLLNRRRINLSFDIDILSLWVEISNLSRTGGGDVNVLRHAVDHTLHKIGGQLALLLRLGVYTRQRHIVAHPSVEYSILLIGVRDGRYQLERKPLKTDLIVQVHVRLHLR